METSPRDPGGIYMEKLTAKIAKALEPSFFSLQESIARESTENKRRLDNIDAAHRALRKGPD